MDKKKEKEELATIICGEKHGTIDFICVPNAVDNILNAGYRKADEVRKETAKEILDEVWALVNRKDTINLSTRIKEIAERNGVEVDE